MEMKMFQEGRKEGKSARRMEEGEERQQQNAKVMEDERGVGRYKGKWG